MPWTLPKAVQRGFLGEINSFFYERVNKKMTNLLPFYMTRKIVCFWTSIFCSLLLPTFAAGIEKQQRDALGILIKVSGSYVDHLRKNQTFVELTSRYRLKERKYFSIAEVLVLDSPVATSKSELLDVCREIAKIQFATICELNIRLKPHEYRGFACLNPQKPFLLGGLMKFYKNLHQQQCSFPLVEGEDWDVFWAQHYVGADLLREEIERSSVTEYFNPASIVSVWDLWREKHGEYVSNIVTGPKASAVIPAENPIPYRNIQFLDLFLLNYEVFSRACSRNENCPSYINASLPIQGAMSFLGFLISSMHAQGTTFVVSANNDGKLVPSVKRKLSLDKKIIVVASLAPDGRPSNFTSFGDTVTISAPSDFSIRSYDDEGNPHNFSGTSGAAPLVTGTLGGFTLLSQLHLNTRQADLLLRKTAIPIPNLPTGHLLGAGMLNAYKIGMIAHRIKNRCRDQRGDGKDKCLSDLLESEGTYRFEEESSRLFEEAMESFPQCSGKQSGNIDDCGDKMEAFNNLRRAALLNSTDPKMWDAVACVKEYFGVKKIAFYRSLAKHLYEKADEDKILADICTGRTLSSRFTKYLSESSFLNLIMKEECSPLRVERGLHYMLDRGIRSVMVLIKEILDHPKVTDYILDNLSNTVRANPDKFFNPQELLGQIEEKRKSLP